VKLWQTLHCFKLLGPDLFEGTRAIQEGHSEGGDVMATSIFADVAATSRCNIFLFCPDGDGVGSVITFDLGADLVLYPATVEECADISPGFVSRLAGEMALNDLFEPVCLRLGHFDLLLDWLWMAPTTAKK
jgi:hypothetical protein